jgi:L-lactate dehydrogenase
MTANLHAQPTRIAVVGAGSVGATFAYALLLSGLAAEIVLIDANRAKAEGEAMDLNHTVPFTHARCCRSLA